MKIQAIQKVDDAEYLRSDRWKCETSPSKGHYWVIVGQIQTCRYCGKTKHLPKIYPMKLYGPRKPQNDTNNK